MITGEFIWAHRQSENMYEANDCSVMAMSIVTGRPYAEVHAAFELCGRKRRDGVSPDQFLLTARVLGLELAEVHEPRRAIQLFDRGESLFFMTSDHVFAATGCKIHDPAPSYDLVCAYVVKKGDGK